MWARQVHWYGWRALSSRSVSHVHSTWTCSVYQRWNNSKLKTSSKTLVCSSYLHGTKHPQIVRYLLRNLIHVVSDEGHVLLPHASSIAAFAADLLVLERIKYDLMSLLRYLWEYTHGEGEDWSHHVSLVVAPQTGQHLLENRNEFAYKSGPHVSHRLFDQVVDLRVILVLDKEME